ncbi:hypothetical protein FRC06_011869 [Ceratobasidium sp. 370]|nr:hypothetical protein FRC06_011869 [Ceratobasidium sp. 370]
MIALRFAALASLAAFVAAAPVPWDGGDAYTGVGGGANGGTVYGSPNRGPLGLGPIKAININSGNGGNGGAADSGVAVAGQGGDRITKGKGGKKSKSSASGSAGGNSYSGAGGQAHGGSIYDDGGVSLLNIGTGNGGDAGSATSGSSFGGNAGNIIG